MNRPRKFYLNLSVLISAKKTRQTHILLLLLLLFLLFYLFFFIIYLFLFLFYLTSRSIYKLLLCTQIFLQ
jgi:hypothetical protein